MHRCYRPTKSYWKCTNELNICPTKSYWKRTNELNICSCRFLTTYIKECVQHRGLSFTDPPSHTHCRRQTMRRRQQSKTSRGCSRSELPEQGGHRPPHYSINSTGTPRRIRIRKCRRSTYENPTPTGPPRNFVKKETT